MHTHFQTGVATTKLYNYFDEKYKGKYKERKKEKNTKYSISLIQYSFTQWIGGWWFFINWSKDSGADGSYIIHAAIINVKCGNLDAFCRQFQMNPSGSIEYIEILTKDMTSDGVYWMHAQSAVIFGLSVFFPQ